MGRCHRHVSVVFLAALALKLASGACQDATAAASCTASAMEDAGDDEVDMMHSELLQVSMASFRQAMTGNRTAFTLGTGATSSNGAYLQGAGDSGSAHGRKEGFDSLAALAPDPHATVAENAQTIFDKVATVTDLVRNFTDDEVNLYRARFVQRMQSQTLAVGASAEGSSWWDRVKLALHGEQPVVTAHMVSEINRLNVGWHSRLPADGNLSVRDVQEHSLGFVPYDGLPEHDDDGAVAEDSHNLPESFDAREKWTRCAAAIGHARSQGQCGSCWAFAAATALDGQLCIATNAHFVGDMAWTSAGYITSCYTMIRDGCQGGNPGFALQKAAAGGVPTRGCVPYFGTGDSLQHFDSGNNFAAPACPEECQSRQGYPRHLREDRFYPRPELTTSSSLAVSKEAVYANGPIPISFVVYSDFMSYAGGYYNHVSGNKMGAHATAMIGWTLYQGEDYVLSVNSWGTHWGEDGEFKLHSGCCDLGFYLFKVHHWQHAIPLPEHGADSSQQYSRRRRRRREDGGGYQPPHGDWTPPQTRRRRRRRRDHS